MKKISSVFTGIVLAIILFIIFQSLNDKKITTGSISKRSQIYLNKQKQQENSEWRVVDSENKQMKKNETRSFEITGCLSFSVPFPILTTKLERPCFMMVTTSSPRGHIRVYRTTTNHDNLDDIGDITMRRRDKTLYHEETKVFNTRKFLLFKRKDEFSYENIAFYLHDKALYIISMSYPTSENLDENMYKLVNSLHLSVE